MSSLSANMRRSDGAKEDILLGRILTFGAVLVAAALLVYLLLRLILFPLTAIRHVVIESDVTLSEKEILAQAGLSGTEHFGSLQTLPIQRRLEANPLVQRARVDKLFPDTIRLVIHRREPVALVLAETGGRSIPVLVDRDGYLFKPGASGAEVDLPVVSGLVLGEVGLGTQLPQAYRSLFADLAALRAKSPSLFRLISEVCVVARQSSGGSSAGPAVSAVEQARRTSSTAPEVRELLLYLLSSPVRIRTLGTIDESLLKSSLMVMDLLSNQGVLGDIQELDFRSGDAVYRAKEG